MCCGSAPGLLGLAYAPGIGTESYCCSPGAAGMCSFMFSAGGSMGLTGGETWRSCCVVY